MKGTFMGRKEENVWLVAKGYSQTYGINYEEAVCELKCDIVWVTEGIIVI